MAERLLEVDDLQVSFVTEDGVVRAVDGVSFTLDRGEVVAIVGESGSGKSVTAMTLMGLTRGPNSRFAGSARLGGRELVTATEDQLQRIRGEEIAMIFQDPISSLSPVHRIGDQIVEQIRAHEKVSKAAALDRTVQLMERVGIPRAAERARAYPHEFSGGMRQRAMIAMALSLSPSVLIADEPTTALDVTIQAQILEEIRALSRESDSGVIFVTHDLGVVADIADRVVVMYSGRVVEQGTLNEIFYDPQHPYTWGLLGSVTRMDREPPHRLPAIPGQPPSLVNAPTGLPLPAALPARVRQVRRGAAAGVARRATTPIISTAAGSTSPRSARAVRSRTAASGSAGIGGGVSEDSTTAAPEPGGRATEAKGDVPMLEAEHVQLYFPIKQGVLIDRTVGHVHAVDDVSLRLDEGETLGRGGRVGLRQEHPGALLRPAARADRRRDPLPRPRTSRTSGRKAARSDAQRGAARLPGPRLVAEPAQAGRADRGHAAAPARDGGPARWRGACATCSSASGSTPSTSTASPTSSPAASASASASPGPWPWTRS